MARGTALLEPAVESELTEFLSSERAMASEVDILLFARGTADSPNLIVWPALLDVDAGTSRCAANGTNG